MFRATVLAFSLVCISNFSWAQFGNGSDSSGSGGMANGFPEENHGQNMENSDELHRKLGEFSRNAAKARPKFASLFDQAQNAIMKNDMKKAEGLVAKLHEIQNLNQYEEARLHLVDYWYFGKQGNKESEYAAAAKLMAVGAGNIDSHAYVEAGMRLLKRQYNNQDLGGSIETLNNLRKDSESQTELMSILSVVQKLDAIAEQQTDVVQKITVNESGVWSAKLFKPQFYFNGINGEISALAFDCTNKQTTLNYKADSVMEIPEAWGSCTMKVNAKPNTTFNLVQKKPA